MEPTESTKAAIGRLGALLREHEWQMYHGPIRCEVIGETKSRVAVEICPVAMAVTTEPHEHLDAVLKDPRHSKFHQAVEQLLPQTREQLLEEDPDTFPATLEAEARVIAAAQVVHEDPKSSVAQALLNVQKDTLNEIVNAADTPETETGRLLMEALASPLNRLQADYEQAHGA